MRKPIDVRYKGYIVSQSLDGGYYVIGKDICKYFWICVGSAYKYIDELTKEGGWR